jgi:hypothetical protein
MTFVITSEYTRSRDMKHNANKITSLNSIAQEFYYCVDKRDYVHSTTFLLLAHKLFDPYEVTVSLKTPVKHGFLFGGIPDESDLGYIEIDNNIFYIKPNDESIQKLTEEDVVFEQQLLFSYQRLITSGAAAMNKEKKKLLSRKLTVFCPLLFEGNSQRLEVKKTVINRRFTLYDILIDNTIAWRQLLWG